MTATRVLLFVALLSGLGLAVLSAARLADRARRPERPTAAAPASPTRTVAAFYRALGRRDFTAAWGLVGPDFKRRRSFLEWQRRHAGLTSVELERVRLTGEGPRRATVAVAAVLHGLPERRCEGEQSLVRGPRGGWLIEPGVPCLRVG